MAGQLSTIRLSRYDAQPWGFRLQGGLDFGTPLIVQKVSELSFQFLHQNWWNLHLL